ncbi:hypothetical protein QR46_2885 [Giardia duodenalis assemblage B]|uniref:FAM13A-like domain-containing protein n=1 Tax=Giardia duodenalis assemblage B TaxID=1394984 RepID=A0A132NSW3_GIAIN|nr:hypothetical protein QR46_2885 [Giardia intestinalis assemblage B]
MSLSSDFIRTPIFDKILSTITTSITDFSTRQTPLLAYSTIEPSIQSVKSASTTPSVASLSPYVINLIDETASRFRKNPFRLTFNINHHQPEKLESLNTSIVFNHPYKLSPADRKSLSPTDPILESWAKGVICAYVQGWKGRRTAKSLITPRDTLPLTEMHLYRCQQAVLRARKKQNVVPVNVQTGQPIVSDKKKVLSSILTTPGSTPVATTSSGSGLNLQLIRDNRAILKSVLKEFNIQFEKQFHREPSRMEKEALRPLYVEYKTLKVFLPDDDDDDKPSKLAGRDKRSATTAGAGKLNLVESEALILSKVAQVRATVEEASKFLQRPVPTDQVRLKQFKREIQKCLFELKEQYETVHAEVNAYKVKAGKYPGDLTSKWAQNCVDTYHMLYSAYEKIKRKLDV